MRNRSFGISFVVILLAAAWGFAFQKLRPDFSVPLSLPTLFFIAGCAAFAVLVVLFARNLFYFLTSPTFAAALVFVVLAAVAAGTLILQNAPPRDYRETYGETLTSVFRLLFLDDVFHSVWFNSLLALMALSLCLAIVKRRPFRPAQLGLLFSHSGIVLILAGAMIGTIHGKKGFIHLWEGEKKAYMYVMEKGKLIARVHDPGFTVRLDDFQLEYYPDEHRIYAFQKDDRSIETIASWKAVVSDASNKIPGWDIYFRVLRADLEAPVGAFGRHILRLGESGRESTVEIGGTYDIGDGMKLEVLRFFPNFKYSIAEKRAFNLSDEPRNPALEVRLVGDPPGEPFWLFSDRWNTRGLVYLFVTAVVEIEVTTPEGTAGARLRDVSVGHLLMEGGRVALVLRKREKEVKAYRSLVSIWAKGDEVERGAIEVNSPLSYGGYMIYQSEYDPDDPTYSGFQVVKDPGIITVYAGFILLCLGPIWIFYVRPRIVARKDEE